MIHSSYTSTRHLRGKVLWLLTQVDVKDVKDVLIVSVNLNYALCGRSESKRSDCGGIGKIKILQILHIHLGPHFQRLRD
jgi:hypothetical protein